MEERMAVIETNIVHINATLSELKSDMRAGFADVKREFAAVNGRIDGFKDSATREFGAVNGRIDGVKDAVTHEFGAVNGRIDGVKDAVTHEFGAVNGRIDEFKDAVKLEFSTVNGRIDDLKDAMNASFLHAANQRNNDLKWYLGGVFSILTIMISGAAYLAEHQDKALAALGQREDKAIEALAEREDRLLEGMLKLENKIALLRPDDVVINRKPGDDTARH